MLTSDECKNCLIQTKYVLALRNKKQSTPTLDKEGDATQAISKYCSNSISNPKKRGLRLTKIILQAS